MKRTDFVKAFAELGIDLTLVSEIRSDVTGIVLKSYFGPDGKVATDPATGEPHAFTTIVHFDRT